MNKVKGIILYTNTWIDLTAKKAKKSHNRHSTGFFKSSKANTGTGNIYISTYDYIRLSHNSEKNKKGILG